MAMAPFAAASLRMGDKDKGKEALAEVEDGPLKAFKEGAEGLVKNGRQLYDRIYYGFGLVLLPCRSAGALVAILRPPPANSSADPAEIFTLPHVAAMLAL